MDLKNKRVIIHLGPPKTGTSAIQFWLSSHVEKLADQGVFYPDHRHDRNNISSGNVRNIFHHGRKVKPEINRNALKTLMKQFEASGCSTLLLSSEFFAQRIDQLRAVLMHLILPLTNLRVVDVQDPDDKV